MKRYLLSLLFVFWLSGQALAVDVRLSWAASGSTGVIGYRVYYGTASRVYNYVGSTAETTYLVTNVNAASACYFAVKAYSATADSAYSTELRGAVISQSVQGQGTIEGKQSDWTGTTTDPVFIVEAGTGKSVIVTLAPASIEYILSALSLDGTGVSPVVSELTIPSVAANHTVFGVFTRQSGGGSAPTLRGSEYQRY